MNKGMLTFPLRPWHYVPAVPLPPSGPDQKGEAKGSRTVSLCYPNKQDVPSSCPAQGPVSVQLVEQKVVVGAAFFSWVYLLLRPVLYFLLAPLLYLAELNRFGKIINRNIPFLQLLAAARSLLWLLCSLHSA